MTGQRSVRAHRWLWLPVLVCATACGRFGFDPAARSTNDGAVDRDGAVDHDGADGGEPDGAFADACSASAPVPITSVAGSSLSPSLTSNGTGYGVTWYDRRNGTYNIYTAVLDANGVKQAAEVDVTQSTNNHAWFPSIAWSGSEYGVTWGEEASSNDIYFQRVSSAGVPVGTKTMIGGGNGEAWWSVITWTGSGYFTAWADDTVGNYELLIAVRSATGTQVRSQTSVTATSAKTWSPASVSTGSEVAVVYTEADSAVWVQRFLPDGQLVGAAQLVLSTSGVDRPRVAWSGSGFGVVWSDTHSGNQLVYMARLDATGARIGDVLALSNRRSTLPVITWTGAVYAIAWLEEVSVADWKLFVATVDPSGVLRSPPTAVANAFGNDWPSIAWSGSRLGIAYTNGADPDVYFVSVVCP